MNLNIWFISTGLLQGRSSFKGYNVHFRPDFPQEPSVIVLGHVCHLDFLAVQGDLLASFKACCHGATVSETTEWSPTQKVLSKLSLNKYCRYPHPVHMDSEVLTWCKIQSIENQWTNRGLGAMAEIFWDFNPEGK